MLRFLAVLPALVFFSNIVHAQQQGDDHLAKLNRIAGISFQEFDGNLALVDFRQCKYDWLEGLELLSKFPTVHTLSMGGPLVKQKQLDQLAALPNLKFLRIEQSDIGDLDLTSIASLQKLEELNLDRCSLLKDDAMGHLSRCKTLRRLRLPGTPVSSTGQKFLDRLERLELLDLQKVSIDEAGVRSIRGLTKLRNLSLFGPGITDEALKHLSGMTNLTALTLRNCSITDAGFQSVAGLTKLKEVDLFESPVGDGALATLVNAKELNKLKIRGTKITPQGIQANITQYPNLTLIDLGETQVDDSALQAISELKNLEDLNLLRTQVTDVGIKFLTDTKLKKLNLDDNAGITDQALTSIVRISSLQFLHLGKTHVTDQGLSQLAALTQLKDLIINNTSVSQQAIEELQKKLPDLRVKR